MPGADLARIFGAVFSKAEERAKSEEEKNAKAKDEDIQMYRKVLFDPNSSPEQREKAADQITKLRGINKKESPFGKIAGMLNHVKSKMPQNGQAQSQPMDEKNPVTSKQAAPSATGQGGVAEGASKSNVGQSQQQEQTQEQPKRGGAMAAMGRMLSGQGIMPRHPQTLPPLDPSVFPTATDVATAQKNAEKITHVNQFKQVNEDFKEAFGRDMTPEERDTHFKLTPPPKIATKLEQDANSPTGWSFVSYDQLSGKEYSRQQNAPPQRGLITSETETTQTDPAGQKTTTHSVRKPVLNPLGNSPVGLKQKGNINLSGRPVLHNPDGTISSEKSFSIGTDKGEVLIPLIVDGKELTKQQAIDHYKQTGEHMGIFDTPEHADAYANQVHNRKLGSREPVYVYQGAATPKRQLTPISQSNANMGHSVKTGEAVYDKYGLDQTGHIPDTSKDNPQIRTLANQLLDGQDVGKIKGPSRDILAGQALAEKYGWSQGKFTPKEQVMLRESTTFLKSAANDKSLKALDGDFTQRMKMAQVAKNPDKEGMIGRGLSVVAAQNLTEDQKNFIQTYNQLVGTISGLAQLVRSGRATEATIERLKAELPNPVSTKDSKDAKERIQRILKEVDVAMQKGTFTGQDSGKSSSNVEDILRKHKVID